MCNEECECIVCLEDAEASDNQFNADRIKAENLLEKYQGTCEFLSDEDSDVLYLESPDAGEHFDNFIFYCDECNWWCEIHEQSDEDATVCQDCKNGE